MEAWSFLGVFGLKTRKRPQTDSFYEYLLILVAGFCDTFCCIVSACCPVPVGILLLPRVVLRTILADMMCVCILLKLDTWYCLDRWCIFQRTRYNFRDLLDRKRYLAVLLVGWLRLEVLGSLLIQSTGGKYTGVCTACNLHFITPTTTF